MHVAVRPYHPDLLKDEFFSTEHVMWKTAVHTEPFIRLKEVLRQHGVEIATWDMHPPEWADILYMQDLPYSRREWLQIKKRYRRARYILELVETPNTRPYFFVKKNHQDFDAILTYNEHLCDEPRYIHSLLPHNVPVDTIHEVPFSQRKPLVMINTNLWLAILTNRQRGMYGIPLLGRLLGGWPYPLGNLIQNENLSELYSRRRRLARSAERECRDLLDIYGRGWDGGSRGWIYCLLPNSPYKCLVEPLIRDKSELLSRYRFCVTFENAQTNFAWITEKLFDALNAGVVPIYLGAHGISDYVWPEAFVDARQFKGDRELLEFARDCSEEKWNELRAQGRRYLASTQAWQFTAEAYAQRVSEVILRAAEKVKAPVKVQA
ncbi:MAG TPA: glycosyltransferase family 10 [Tepidisphaeraceae bacterium]|nr:glycosyltransferase family 10 [Tepidisphaeraceae bacterium]